MLQCSPGWALNLWGITLSQPGKGWNYRLELPHLACFGSAAAEPGAARAGSMLNFFPSLEISSLNPWGGEGWGHGLMAIGSDRQRDQQSTTPAGH